MQNSDTKLYFLVYIILVSINVAININYLQLILLTSSFFFIFSNKIISLICLSMWMMLFSRRKEGFVTTTYSPNTLKPIKPDSYYKDICKSIHIGEKNCNLFVSNLTIKTKNTIYYQTQRKIIIN